MIKTVFKFFRLALFSTLLLGASLSLAVRAETPLITVLHVEGTIVPVVADYLERSITEAEGENAAAVIIELDTPGGLLDATEQIVQKIMNANVPVVVYVSPKGAWAASAGTFITLSAHIAAMTPGSTMGAAHPVTAGGEQIPEEQMKKITEFSAKWMRTIAQERGRNIEEAELAVTESKSFTDVDALEAKLIDLRANTLPDLISQINGREVTLANGTKVTLNTSGYEISRDEMSAIERFLHAISDPNIAYILLSIGSIGIIAEIYAPGSLFPGTVGAISLLTAFYSLGVLKANLAGILLILLAFGLFVAEVFTAGFGVLTAGGIVSLILGSLILFPRGGGPMFQVSGWLIAVVVIIISALFAFVINRVILAHRRQATIGKEEFAGKTAIAREALKPEGTVLFEGELWKARAEKGKIEPGEEVTVTRVDGLKLWVTKKKKEVGK